MYQSRTNWCDKCKIFSNFDPCKSKHCCYGVFEFLTYLKFLEVGLKYEILDEELEWIYQDKCKSTIFVTKLK